MENLFALFDGAKANQAELEYAFLFHFLNSTQLSERELGYGGEPEDFRLRLRHNKKGQIDGIFAGPGIQPGDWEWLEATIEDLAAPGKISVAQMVAMASFPAMGFYRWKSELQLLPVPPGAPVNRGADGEHPLLLEASYRLTKNRMVNAIRAPMALGRAERMLVPLVEPGFGLHMPGRLFAWVYETVGENGLTSAYKQQGYIVPMSAPHPGTFTDTDGIRPFLAISPEEYYLNFARTLDAEFQVPDNLDASLERVAQLSPDDRKAYDLASYWIKHAATVWHVSRSAAFVALVQAVEAFLPREENLRCTACGKPTGKGPSALFRDFIEEHTGPVTSNRQRADFYDLRSSITHGSKILEMDLPGNAFGFGARNEDFKYRMFRAITRIAVINWLHSRKVSQ